MSDDRETGGWRRGRLGRPGGVGPPRPVCSSKNCVRASGWRSLAGRGRPRWQDPSSRALAAHE